VTIGAPPFCAGVFAGGGLPFVCACAVWASKSKATPEAEPRSNVKRRVMSCFPLPPAAGVSKRPGALANRQYRRVHNVTQRSKLGWSNLSKSERL